MQECIKLFKLDWMLIKQYRKEVVMFILMLTIIIGSTLPFMLNIIIFLLINNLISYPFIIEEKDKMDKFYSMIAVNREDILKSKYLSILIYILIILLILIPINIIIQSSKPAIIITRETILLYASIGVLLSTFIASIQIPCYLKWGYSQSKMITMILPIAIGFGIPIIVVGGSKLIGREILKNVLEDGMYMLNHHYDFVVLVCLLVSIICYVVSYLVSRKIYIKNNR